MRSAALTMLLQNTLRDERVDFARRGVLRDLEYLRPLGRSEIALKADYGLLLPFTSSPECFANPQLNHQRAMARPGNARRGG